MRILEDELEMKDARMAELEWELESMRVRMRDLEGLEHINISLERRIEALTNLLVQSPTRLDVSSSSTSPVRVDPSKRTPRPRSMLPRIPASPGGLRSPLETVCESTVARSKSLGSASAIAESPEDLPGGQISEEILQSPICSQAAVSPHHTRHSGSFDGRSRTSASTRSATSSNSRPMSMRSSGSFRPISWDIPEQEPGSTTKQRKMRRFPSGSNSLKPLILPCATGGPSLPASAPVYPSIDATAQRDFSAVSFDAKTAFLSTLADDSAQSTPDKPVNEHSATWVQEQTLKALEGKFRDTDSHGNNVREASLSLSPEDEEASMGFREISADRRKRRSRPRSLLKELEEAEEQAAEAQAEAEAGCHEKNGEGLIHVEDHDGSEQMFHGMDPTPSKPSLPASRVQQRCLAPCSRHTMPHSQRPFPPLFPTPSSLKTASSTGLTCDHAHGLFSRLTSVITQTKQQPCVLARRLLANAWSQGSKRLGGMGWWLLGLVYGSRWRKYEHSADTGIVGDDPTRDSEWQQFSAHASSRSTTEHYFRDYGGTHNNRQSGFSPPHVSRRIVPPIAPPSNSNRQPQLFPCEECEEPSSRRTFRLWFQFSIAIILAVGIAVKHGPGTLLPASPPRRAISEHVRSREREPLLQGQRQRQSNRDRSGRADETSRRLRVNTDLHGSDSRYGSITFAQTLGPADFESL